MSGEWRTTARRQLIEAARLLDEAQATIANAADHEPVPFELADAIDRSRREIRDAMNEAVAS